MTEPKTPAPQLAPADKVREEELEARLRELAICDYCKLHPDEVGEPGETCSLCDERYNVASQAAYLGRNQTIKRVRDMLSWQRKTVVLAELDRELGEIK